MHLVLNSMLSNTSAYMQIAEFGGFSFKIRTMVTLVCPYTCVLFNLDTTLNILLLQFITTSSYNRFYPCLGRLIQTEFYFVLKINLSFYKKLEESTLSLLSQAKPGRNGECKKNRLTNSNQSGTTLSKSKQRNHILSSSRTPSSQSGCMIAYGLGGVGRKFRQKYHMRGFQTRLKA